MKARKHLLGYLAIAMACIMIGSSVAVVSGSPARAETTPVVVTSPFTAAISEVRGSVVGVNNYQMVRYSNRGSSWDDPFGFGFGYGYGYGHGYGGDYGNSREQQTQEVLAGSGSGVVIGEGYVLTNYHVVENASRLEIAVYSETSNEPATYATSLVAFDENLDVAIVYAPELDLPAVELGDSDSLQVGDWAICIGNPLSEQFSGTVTVGVVSALNRAVSSTNVDKYGRRATTTNAMIQTDAAINAGNSGGGMFSVTGQLMGIPTLKYTGSAYSGTSIEGIGMCIPINAAKPLIEDVLSGRIAATNPEEADGSSATSLIGRPRMGITVSDLNQNSSAVRSGVLPMGVYVSEVDGGSPAHKAGMQPGDIIVDVNNTVITSIRQMNGIIAGKTAGDVLQVKVYRAEGMADAMNGTGDLPQDGEYVDLQVELAVVDQVKQ